MARDKHKPNSASPYFAIPTTQSSLQIRNSSRPYVQALLDPRRGPKVLESLKVLSDPIIHHILKRIAPSSRAMRGCVGIPFPKSYDDFLPELPLKEASTLIDELRWTANVLCHFAEPLSRLLRLKQSIESQIVQGQIQDAQDSFAKVTAEYGYSHWSIEIGTLLAHLQGGIKLNRDYLSRVNDENKDYLATVTAQFASQRAERSISFAGYDEGVRSFFQPAVVTEGRETPAMTYLRFKVHFFSAAEFTHTHFKSILSVESSYALIDRLHVFIRILTYLAAGPNGRALLLPLAPSVVRLSLSLDETRLATLAHFLMPELTVTETPLTTIITNALDAYTRGNYATALDIAALGCNAFPTSFELYDIYCKSLLRQALPFKEQFASNTLQSQILQSTFSILRKDSNTRAALATLLPIAYALNSSSLADQLFAFAARQRAVSLPYNADRFSLITSSAQTARFSLVFSEPQETVLYLNQLNNARNDCPTVQLFTELARSRERGGCPSINAPVPESRKAKYEALAYYSRQDYARAIVAFQQLLKAHPVDPLLREDCIRHLFHCFLASRRLADCATLVSDTYFENKNLLLAMPLSLLLEAYERAGGADYSSDLVWPVVRFLFYVEYDLPRDSKSLFVLQDSFLAAHDVERPSDLFERHHLFPHNQWVLFLRHICVPEVLDSSIAYESTSDLEGERVLICQQLIGLDPDQAEIYSEEISRLTKAAAIREAIHQIDHSKVFVDKPGIRRSLERAFEEYFERYRTLYSLDSRMRQAVIEYALEGRRIKERVNVVYVDQVMELFKDLFADIRERYISSNEHGLDSYLSLRVRHGTLAGQIRNSFESQSLITTANTKTGVYNRNERWTKTFEYLGADKVALVDKELGAFSKRVDETIDEVKNTWIQIRSDTNRDGLFDFDFSSDDLVRFYAEFGNVSDVDAFVDAAFQHLDVRARVNLESVRTRIRNVLSAELMIALNDLEANVKHIHDSVRYSDFSNVISECRTKIQLALEVVAGWFENLGDSPMPDYSLEHLGNTALEVVKRAYPSGSFRPHLQVTTDRKMKGHTFTVLVDILTLLIGNAVKHSGLPAAEVRISIEDFDGVLQIEVENDLGPEVDWKATQDLLDEYKRRIGEGARNRAVRRESGTGYYKLGKLLRYDLKGETVVDITVSPHVEEKPASFGVIMQVSRLGDGP